MPLSPFLRGIQPDPVRFEPPAPPHTDLPGNVDPAAAFGGGGYFNTPALPTTPDLPSGFTPFLNIFPQLPSAPSPQGGGVDTTTIIIIAIVAAGIIGIVLLVK